MPSEWQYEFTNRQDKNPLTGEIWYEIRCTQSLNGNFLSWHFEWFPAHAICPCLFGASDFCDQNYPSLSSSYFDWFLYNGKGP